MGEGLFRSPAHGLRALRLRLPVVAQLQLRGHLAVPAVLRVPGEHAGRCAPPATPKALRIIIEHHGTVV